jgi:predicted RNase H-like HicB family nuclease
MKYTVIIEKTKTGYSAYLPDVPGCIATGRTEKAVQKNMADALEFHFEGLRLAGQPIPRPKSQSVTVSAAMPAMAHA